ncbi:MAG: DUF4136 domain-containing protein [Xanthomonadales bacterium]|nr:DUF4136 domain-containing protein [Xanthomonadales bacterium]
MSAADPSADFSRYKTYNFIKRQDIDGQDYESLEAGFIKAAVSRELKAVGLTLSDNPDIAVNFSVESQEKIRTRSVPTMSSGVAYSPYYGAYHNTWGTTHETRIDQYTEGRLNIDLIDTMEHKVVWQGATKERLTREDYENARKTLDDAVVEILSQLPGRQAK